MVSDAVTARYLLIILEGQREGQRLRAAFERLNVPFSVGLEVSTIDTLKYYVAHGMGVAVISGFSVTPRNSPSASLVIAKSSVSTNPALAAPLNENVGTCRRQWAYCSHCTSRHSQRLGPGVNREAVNARPRGESMVLNRNTPPGLV